MIPRLLTICLLILPSLTTVGQHRFLRQAEDSGIEVVEQLDSWYGHGLALADFDGDGDVDLYLPTDVGVADRLYRNDGHGYFEDVAAELGIQLVTTSRAALWLDYDGDHLLDLVVAVENCQRGSCDHPVDLVLYRQTETGKFEMTSEAAGLIVDDAFSDLPYFAVGGLAAGDLNGDHFLDLVFSVWGGGLKVYLNDGDGTFTDVTRAWSIEPNFPTPWQPLLHDFNDDGRMDILSNVDFLPNQLWINQGDHFFDEAELYGIATNFNEMGVAVADYDNDRDLDIYLTNITRQLYGRQQHNRLLTAEPLSGGRVFKDKSRRAGVGDSGWDWGTTFADINNDGRVDLLTTNGWWDERAYSNDQSRCWKGSVTGFTDVSASWGFNDTLRATTLLSADLDRDGDQDILQTLKGQPGENRPLLIYLNTARANHPQNNYLTVRPRMPGPNHYGIGSVVTLVADGLETSRLITAGTSFYGQEPAEAHFGLGDIKEVKEVIVRWPDQNVNAFIDLPINRLQTLEYQRLEAPERLQASMVDSGILLRWQDRSASETSFEVQLSTDSTFAIRQSRLLSADTEDYVFGQDNGGATELHYRVRACRGSVCSGYSNPVRIINTILPTPSEVDELRVFPNPTSSGRVSCVFSGPFRGDISLLLIDPFGKVRRRLKLIKTVELVNKDFDIQHLPSGVYTLLAEFGSKSHTQRILHNNH